AQGHRDVERDRFLEVPDTAVGQRRVDGARMVRRGWLHDIPPATLELGRAAGLIRCADGVEPVPPDAPLEPGVALVSPGPTPGDRAGLPTDRVAGGDGLLDRRLYIDAGDVAAVGNAGSGPARPDPAGRHPGSHQRA